MPKAKLGEGRGETMNFSIRGGGQFSLPAFLPKAIGDKITSLIARRDPGRVTRVLDGCMQPSALIRQLLKELAAGCELAYGEFVVDHREHFLAVAWVDRDRKAHEPFYFLFDASPVNQGREVLDLLEQVRFGSENRMLRLRFRDAWKQASETAPTPEESESIEE